MSKTSYTHIFTDGLDKVLSASIWLSDYAKQDTFVYYTDRKLKGYIASSDLDRLADEGLSFFRERKNTDALLANSSVITNQINQFHTECKEDDTQKNYLHLFIQTSKLLRSAYTLYFTNEEFMTTKLDSVTDKLIIDEIGSFRLSFMETIIKATKDVHQLAGHIGKFYNLSSDDVEYLTNIEIASLPNNSITSIEITNRKKAFYIQKGLDNSLEYTYGDMATQKFNDRVELIQHTGNTLSGMGASCGKVTGRVYLVSLADPDLPLAIDQMPKGAILVSESTQPHLTIACHKAVGIITDEGGALSHAAIIARELHIPCVVGTKLATEVLHNGQLVSLDGGAGIVTILE